VVQVLDLTFPALDESRSITKQVIDALCRRPFRVSISDFGIDFN
jgi:hypothetical protein